ncbi:Histidine phosphatase superfamily (branch 1) [Rheinheimera pacifica]|uniref:Histidine phosphatase superfamily (Branch 1) n=1 Tax=Rheinheimera pacifica TaxID=173990 RepID=A0A1H6JXI7_9GAMM|nr:histidine phosphatase family protein [Rheinheimera pacifica]SEH64027.1 Histidine phosphatase superfamily (branch 1) [Rheinheimera pacifica]
MKALILLLFILIPTTAQADDTAWAAWREGKALLLMRHALAPGTGDPAGFVLDDCSTQRNLNSEGQQQALRWGKLLRQQYRGNIQLYSSQWCRCLDTARLMALSTPQPLPLLNSFFAGRGDGDKQTQALMQYFSQAQLRQPTVLVTHQVNFTALTGIFPRSGEAVIVALPLRQPATVLAQLNIP